MSATLSPGPLLGFVVQYCYDSIFFVHEVVMNFFQLPDVSKTFMIESFYAKLFFLCMIKRNHLKKMMCTPMLSRMVMTQ